MKNLDHTWNISFETHLQFYGVGINVVYLKELFQHWLFVYYFLY